MSSATPLQTAAVKPPQTARANPFLQRKCACGGGASGLSGECEDCSTKKIVGLQTKLRIDEPDAYEQEADRVAELVLAKPAQPDVRSTPVRIQRLSGRSNVPVGEVPASVDRALASPGRPLEPALRQDMEQRFGHDFSRVRVHLGAAAEQSARDVNANAYTVRNDIVFGETQFVLGTSKGRHLLAHELTHVVQQSGSESSIVRMQRQPRGAAAGCGICMNDPGGRLAGDIAHAEVQGAFIAANPDMVAERPVAGIPNSGIDLSYEKHRRGQHALFIGEIKPLDDAGRQADIGRDQLRDYAREMMLSGEYDEVFRMSDVPPPGPLYFFNPLNPPSCPQQTIVVRLTEPGLYQYYCEPPFSQLVRNPLCRCPRPDDDQPPGPPIFVQPGPQPSETDTHGKGESEGKGDGEPGKGDGEPDIREPGRQPGRTPGRTPGRGPQPNQPTFMIPRWVPGVAILAILGAIVAWGSRTLPGKIAALIGTLLGRLALALGLSLGFFGGTGTATAGGSKGGAGGGSPDGPPKGKIPGKDTVIVPGDTVTVPGETITVPRPDKTKPPAATMPPSQTKPPPQTTAPPARAVPPPTGTKSTPRPTAPTRPKPPPPAATVPAQKEPLPGARSDVPATAQIIRMKLIEGLNLESVKVGGTGWLRNYRTGLRAYLQVVSKVTKGGETTVEFVSLEECSPDGVCGPGGNYYVVTHPYRPTDASEALGGMTSPPK